VPLDMTTFYAEARRLDAECDRLDEEKQKLAEIATKGFAGLYVREKRGGSSVFKVSEVRIGRGGSLAVHGHKILRSGPKIGKPSPRESDVTLLALCEFFEKDPGDSPRPEPFKGPIRL